MVFRYVWGSRNYQRFKERDKEVARREKEREEDKNKTRGIPLRIANKTPGKGTMSLRKRKKIYMIKKK